jgi:succinyl-CoA---D-citramalate CoA-transferase
LAMMESMIPEYALAGHTRERTGNVLPNIAPSNIYPDKDGGWFAIGANADTIFARLCEAMGRPELVQNERYATHTARGANQAELDDLIAEWTVTQSADALQALMDKHGVPGGRIYTAKEMLHDPQFQARQSIVGVPDAELGEIPMQNVTPRLSATPGGIDWTGPALGQHNDEVYQQLLGLASERMAELQAQRVI